MWLLLQAEIHPPGKLPENSRFLLVLCVRAPPGTEPVLGVQLLFSVCRDCSRAAKGRLEKKPGSTGPSASSCTALGCW